MRKPSSQRSRRNMDSGSLMASCVFIVRGQDQEIDVGVRKEFLTPIAAHGQQRDVLGIHCQRFSDDFVDAGGPAGDGCGGVASPEELVPDFLFRHIIQCILRNPPRPPGIRLNRIE